MQGIARPLHPSDFRLVVSAEVDALMLSARHLTPAGVLNHAIDEMTVIASGDCQSGSGAKLTRKFRLTDARLVKIAQVARSKGISENNVAIGAIRQFARNHPTYARP